MKIIANGKWQMAKLAILFLVILLTHHSPLITHHSLAQDSSPSGSLMQKLNELKNEIASKAAQIKSEVNKKVQNKAFIGSISNIGGGEITLQTLNSSRAVKYDEFTEVIGLKNKKIKVETLETGDNIAALGDVDDKNNLVAQRLVFLENFASNSAQLVWGQIQKLTPPSITITNKEGLVEKISTTNQTAFFLGNEEASIADAKAEKYLVARGTRLADGTLRARFIYYIPSVGFIKPAQKAALTSAKSASPSASIKP